LSLETIPFVSEDFGSALRQAISVSKIFWQFLQLIISNNSIQHDYTTVYLIPVEASILRKVTEFENINANIFPSIL
jgi:hypothetical protein